MKINLKNLIFASCVVFLVAFLIGFTVSLLEDTSQQSVIHQQAIYSLSTSEKPQSYTIYNNGYVMDKYVIQKSFASEYEQQQLLFKQQQDEKMYQNFKKSLKNKEKNNPKKIEEQRIEEYCKSAGYWKCMKITETCDEDQCYPVKINCKDSNFDPKWLDKNDPEPDYECDNYDVDVMV